MSVRDVLVDTIVAFHKDDAIKPLKFKYDDKLINIDLIITSDVERQTGNVIFKCFSLIDNFKWHYVLRFDSKNCKWYLSSTN